MQHGSVIAFIGAVTTMVGAASGDVAVMPWEVVSPFDNAQAEVEWRGAGTGITGVIRWIDPVTPNMTLDMFDAATTANGTKWTAPVSYSSGQAITIGYADSPSSGTVFASTTPGAENYIQVRSYEPGVYAMRVEMMQGSVTNDAFFDNAMIVVRFAQMPSPGTAVVMAAGVAAMARRRR